MIDRRVMLGGLFLGGAAMAAGAPALAARPRRARAGAALDLESPEGRLRNFIRIRGALDEGLVIGWASARYYGVIEDRMDPLFAVVSATFARWRAVADGYEAVSYELAWFTDAVTGKAMDTFRNPYTGKDCKVPTGGLAPAKFRIGQDLSFHLGRTVPGLQMEHDVLPFEARGDDVWVLERSRTAMPIPGLARPFRYSESNTFHARRADLARPGATRVTSEVSYTNVCSWRPWLEMGDHPGHLTATGIGRQNAAPESLPPAWVEATRARRPEVLENPAAILQPLWDAKG